MNKNCADEGTLIVIQSNIYGVSTIHFKKNLYKLTYIDGKIEIAMCGKVDKNNPSSIITAVRYSNLKKHRRKILLESIPSQFHSALFYIAYSQYQEDRQLSINTILENLILALRPAIKMFESSVQENTANDMME